ncbi:hypothetical protein [Desulfobacter sp.]|jgi:hypothetical protein|uniref:hypothetical protein n=1 Tax=Desulfobacter sp. TaxID=2294 RepID=UPI003D14A457
MPTLRFDHTTVCISTSEIERVCPVCHCENSTGWINLKTEEEKEKFIFYVFEHDKGYNRIIECIDSWFAGVRPREEDAPDLQRLKQEKGAGGLQKGIGKKAARFC